jgi:transposase
MIKYSIGIDISMKSFHVCLSSIDLMQHIKVNSSTTFANNQKGFKALHVWIEKHYKQKELPLVIVLEATGVYYEQCAMYLFKAGYNVSVILSNKAKKYLQATGIKSKKN